jgi:hypothetical protein
MGTNPGEPTRLPPGGRRVPVRVAALREAGHQVYDFRNPRSGGPVSDDTPDRGFHWSDIDPEWLGWKPERYRDLITTHPVARQGFEADYNAMQWADTCALVLPCGRSAHKEAGWFAGRSDKEVYVLLYEQGFEPELMYLMANGIYVSISELTQALSVPVVAA